MTEASRIAGILDSYGGLRVVISLEGSLMEHVLPDEFLIMVRDETVREPIQWDAIPFIVELAELAVEEWTQREHNEIEAQLASRLYRLRRLEYTQRSLDLDAIVQT